MGRENILLEAESFTTVDESKVSEATKEKSNTENGVYVKGMALPFGKTSRNGVQYEKQSVKEAHKDLQGRTMLFNHKQDWVTGHILNTEITENGMYFEGDINPNAEMPNGVPVAEAIERGDINSVSIQAFIEQLGEEADEDAVIGDMETEKVAVKDFLEISAVSIPGFPSAEALPEHLEHQGVQPITEAVGGQNIRKRSEALESLENPQFEVGDFVEWEFGDGSSQGEITDRKTEVGDSMSAGGNEFTIEEGDGPLYKIEEWDETAGSDGEFTNNVVKFEDALSSADRPEAAKQVEAPEFSDMGDCVSYHMDEKDMDQDQAVAVCMDKMESEDLPETLQGLNEEDAVNREQFEFNPVPTHVLYDNREDAMQRADNLGLEDIHEHEMSGQVYYMAGDNHEEWLQALDRENPLDREKVEALSDVDLTPPERVVNAAELALEKDDELDTDCGTGVGSSRANSIVNDTLSPEDFLGGENTAIPDYLNSHSEDVTAEGPPTDWSDEEWSDCGNLQYAKWGYYLEWFQGKQEELQEAKENVKENDNMTEQQQEEKESGSAQSEQVNQEMFINFVAEHMEGLEPDDVASAVGDSNFTGLDQGAVAELLAAEFELDPGTVMDVIGDLEDMERQGEGDYMDDDEDEEEESSGQDDVSENLEDVERRKLEKRFKDQEEKIQGLEERLEKIVGEDEGSSKQESPGSEKESLIERRPSFKDVL